MVGRMSVIEENKHARATATSGYHGVTWVPERKRWVAQIMINGKVKHLGTFTSELQAAAAYNRASIKYYGRYAVLNNTWGVTSETLDQFKVVRRLTGG